MTREEIKVFLEGQLKKLQEVHVADLMKAWQFKELEKKLADVELDFSPLEMFWNEQDEAIYQSEEEIPKKFLYELVCYMSYSEYDDDYFCKHYKYLQNVLRKTEEEVLVLIAEIMDTTNLSACNLIAVLSAIR